MPRALKDVLKRAYESMGLATLRLASKHGVLASFYYFLINRSFDREHLATIHGLLNYQQNLYQLKASSALLRRNIHRLEKGLIMTPRRPSFAEHFIVETVDIFTKAHQQQSIDSKEFQWAYNVLSEYFTIVVDTPVIAKARVAFEVINSQIDTQQSTDCDLLTPYKYADLPAPQVNPEQLATLFARRRSVRWYDDKPVPHELLAQAVNMASTAPSACNRQPYRFDVATDPERARAIAKLAGGTPGWVQNVQCCAVVVGDLSSYFGEHDRHLIYIDGSLAAMQFMLALDTLGLASCPVNWPDVDSREKNLQAELNLPPYERPIMLITVGYPSQDGGVAFSQKKQSTSLLNIVNGNKS